MNIVLGGLYSFSLGLNSHFSSMEARERAFRRILSTMYGLQALPIHKLPSLRLSTSSVTRTMVLHSSSTTMSTTPNSI